MVFVCIVIHLITITNSSVICTSWKHQKMPWTQSTVTIWHCTSGKLDKGDGQMAFFIIIQTCQGEKAGCLTMKGLWKTRQRLIQMGLHFLSCLANVGLSNTMIDTSCNPPLAAQMCWLSSRLVWLKCLHLTRCDSTFNYDSVFNFKPWEENEIY